MDEKTAQLIERLAAKLGTTAEHLWGVLVRQAPISGATDLGVLIASFAIAALLGVIALRTKDEDEGGMSFAVGMAALIAGASALAMFMSGASIIAAAFFNPEYWALKQILK